VPNPKLETLVDAFTTPTINTTLWGSITAGAVTLDTVNDEISVAVPTTSGATNSFGTSALYDATNSSIYAQVGVAANGAGNVRTAIRIRFDATNAVTMRVESGVFKFTSQTGTTTTLTLPTYDPHAHRWWRLRESAGSFYAATSPDGLTWTEWGSLTYGFDATNITFRLESVANATEVAGNLSTIAHVNTRAGGQYNNNWPLIEDAWGPLWTANAGSIPLDRYIEVSARTRDSVSVSRGRQYELDQVRSGEASLTLDNTDSALDPTNTAGPWYGHIQPYQPYRRRAQWPPTRNLLDQVQATAGDLGGYPTGTIPSGSGGIAVFSATDSSGGSIVSSTSAWQGSTVFQFAVPSGSGSTTRICYTPRFGAVPGQTYTMQIRARNVTASTSLTVRAFIGYYQSTGGSILQGGSPATLTGSATAGWTTLTVTFTLPAGAFAMSYGLRMDSAAASTCSIQVDGWQLEKGSTATTWQCPGAWQPVYAGWTERWPSSWNLSGSYGVVSPAAVDTFSLLSQRKLSDSLTMELNSNSPRFVYKLDDPSGSTSVADWTGNNAPAQLGISKYGAGSITFGNAITAATSTGVYTGGSGTVATVANANPGSNLIGAATFIQLGSAGILGPTDPSAWTRMIAFRYTGPNPPSAMAVLWSAFDRQRANGNPSGSAFYFRIGSDGKFGVFLRGPAGGSGSVYTDSFTNSADGNWHLALVSYSRANGSLSIYLDDAITSYSGLVAADEPTGLVSDNVGGYVDPTIGNGTAWNYAGDISFVAEFPSALSVAAQAIYSAWISSCSGEPSDSRYARILRYAGYNGPSTLQPGMTASMGPAVIDGQDAMSALQAVVDTEGGAHFVDAAGAIQFKARSDRYNALTPQYTFGERADLGEWPYEDCQLDYDSTHLSNEVTVTQESTGQTFRATDAASIAAYFPRLLSRTINSTSSGECQDAAGYLLSRYRQPAQRVSSIKLHPSANPALWPVCLGLELGARVRVMRRPPGGAPVQVDCFVENIAWEFDNTGEAWVTLQCSPADLTPYAIFAAFHTTLASTIAAGVSTITINAGSDNQNPAAAQIGQGQQLVLGLGTANAETVTVLSVASTSPGWATATVTLQAATTQAHTAGDIVCEPLPSGITDPATYDASAKFDASNFAY
jgi:hypothetical protein